MEIPVSIALFFLLSGFFLFTLLAALQRSGKAGIAAAAFLVATALVIGLVRPVALWRTDEGASDTTTTDTQVASSDTTEESPDGTGSTTISSSTTTESTTTTTLVAGGRGWEETFKLGPRW